MKIIQYKTLIPSAVQGLGETMDDCEGLFKAQIEKGIAKLWHIENHSWMITRVDEIPGRKPELVVCCYKGRDLNTVTREILKAANEQGFGSIRYHTRRKGLNRLVSDLGFEYLETIYQKVLDKEAA